MKTSVIFDSSLWKQRWHRLTFMSMSNSTLLGWETSVKCHSLSIIWTIGYEQSTNRICSLTALSFVLREAQEKFAECLSTYAWWSTLAWLVRYTARYHSSFFSTLCMQARLSDNTNRRLYTSTYTARIRPIGYGLGIRQPKRNLNYRVCPINTWIIHRRKRERE